MIVKVIIFFLIVVSLFSCERYPTIGKLNINQVPAFAAQNIDSVSSCDIITTPGIKIIKTGNSYTAMYSATSGLILYKYDKSLTNLDFGLESYNMQFFSDSCSLKENLRWFIKMEITKYKFYNQ